ncbi:uncharacterized protein LOC143288028 isoform X2 [Babylonia areolata]|uniref:uncharacterized protein LOC143288028 isoform X2 n=1 Tax=Babylonia areolata TaxID=304850 RepID=UPI003FD11050
MDLSGDIRLGHHQRHHQAGTSPNITKPEASPGQDIPKHHQAGTSPNITRPGYPQTSPGRDIPKHHQAGISPNITRMGHHQRHTTSVDLTLTILGLQMKKQ